MTQFFFLLGLAVVLWGSLDTFRREVFKPEGSLGYYICMSMFVGSNLALYSFLIQVTTPMEVEALFVKKEELATPLPDGVASIAPFVVSILFMMSGNATLPFLDQTKTISQWLLELFADPFKLSLEKRVEILNKIDRAAKERQSLDEALKVLHEYGWTAGDQQDESVKQDVQRTEAEIEKLKGLEEALATGEPAASMIENISKIEKHLQQDLNKKITDYILRVISQNLKNASQLVPIFRAVGISTNEKPEASPRLPINVELANIVAFSLIAGFLISFFLLSTRRIAGIEIGAVEPGWYFFKWFLAILIFYLVLSLGARVIPWPVSRLKNAAEKRSCLTCLLLSGFCAGLAGHLVLLVARQLDDGQESMEILQIAELLGDALIGAIFGAAAGCSLFILRAMFCNEKYRIESDVRRVIVSMSVGFVSFFIIALVIRLGVLDDGGLENSLGVEIVGVFLSACIGAIAVTAAATMFGMIFGPEEHKEVARKIRDSVKNRELS
mgnify:FL=1